MRLANAYNGSALVALAACALMAAGVAPQAAAARPPSHRVSISLAAPRRVAPGGTALASGRATGRRAVHLVLRERTGGGWRTVARGVSGPGGAYLLRARAPSHTGVFSLRVDAAAGASGSSRVARVTVARGAPTVASSSTQAVVIAPAGVLAVPAPGSPGQVVLAGSRQLATGSVLAVGVGPSTPEGFLGKITTIARQGGRTVLGTAPATLQEALPEGSFELENAASVASLRRPRAASEHSAAGSVAHAASAKGGGFNHDLSKAISCAGGASFTATGKAELSATPQLKLSWSLFKGVSASFTETVAARASLTGTISGAAECKFDKTGLLAHPAPLGTFAGDVFGIPVVVTLQGQIYLEGVAKAQGSVSAGVSGEASAFGGVSYAGGHVSIIGPSTSLHFGAQGPSLQASATLGAHVIPELQVLLYGIGGPVFDVRTGLDFGADINADPWWTLTSPLEVSAKLAVPALNLDSPSLKLYSHTFAIANAGGPLAQQPQAPAPPPPPPAAVPGTGPSLIYDANTAGHEFENDTSFTNWASATGEEAQVSRELPPELNHYRCVALLLNESLEAPAREALTHYLRAGGTIVAIGEHAGGNWDVADATLNSFLGSLGAGLSIDDNELDSGPHVTGQLAASPLTAGVGSIGYDWVSSVTTSGSAWPLVYSEDGLSTLVGVQSLDGGTLVVAGDSNMFSDNDDGAYLNDGNGQFVRNICP